MNTYSEVKDRILALSGERNMSIYMLSIRSGVSPSTIKSILYGKSKNPGAVTLKMLCDGFGISLYEFFDTEAFRSTDPEDI
ncbi:MAG: helix-turn-helix transcriptional regulator [Clostridia bacterium]|nr:helix-turn-helix transcriptional regulator [Clostridia bacterium]